MKFKPKFEGPYRFLSVQNNNVVIWSAGRRATVNIDQVRIYNQRKSDEGVVDVDSSVSSRSEYQSKSLEENRPRLDQSLGFRSSESGERQVELGEKTSLTGNKSGRREQQVNKYKRSRGLNESSIELRQQQYKKTRQVVMRCKRKVPFSWSAGPERKRKNTNKRLLMSSSTSTKQVKKRVKKTKENFGQVPNEDLRPGPEEGSLQSSQIQREAFSRQNPYPLNHHRQSRQQGRQEPEKSLKSRRSSPSLSRQQGRQEPKESPRSQSYMRALATDHVILNHGQVMWTTPELALPLLTTTPHQREDVSALDRFNVHRCPTRRVFSGTEDFTELTY
ncbi:uncharacterized protein TNCV_2126051 [Trichonephila clavipes]|nr:uncharacterized protein TNCV_2126051 [Trichonephila clavipes]